MTKLSDLMDLDQLEIELQDGYVRQRSHPLDPALLILNYTEKAQYEKHWNDITTQCRGLIVDYPTGRILARPFDKFFNVGEHDIEQLANRAGGVRCTDKLDGSLGISYIAPDGLPAIATRGSFISDQAQHATQLLRTRYRDWEPRAGLTYLFEIVYPENRIVLDYGDLDDLILLGARRIETGATFGPETTDLLRPGGWPGPRAEILSPSTFREAIAFGDRTNREGMVVTFCDGLMVKIKQEDYVALHKLVTGLNERVVWEHLSAHNGSYDELLASIPDEFHAWVKGVADQLLEDFEVKQGLAHYAYQAILAEAGCELEPGDRPWFAHHAKQYGELTPLLFQLLDGRDISVSIWKTLKPRGQTASLMDRNEDNA